MTEGDKSLGFDEQGISYHRAVDDPDAVTATLRTGETALLPPAFAAGLVEQQITETGDAEANERLRELVSDIREEFREPTPVTVLIGDDPFADDPLPAVV